VSEQSVGDGPVRRTDVLRASPPMFESRMLDAFSRVHPAVPVLIFVPVIVAFEAWGLSFVSAPEAVGLFAVGYALWTLFEYWLHRVVFHFEPDRGIGARMHWIIHGIHHEHPNDPLRLVMPPAVSIPLGAVVFGVLYVVFGKRHAPGIGAGFFAGYLAYDMLHYYVLHFRPRSPVG
jgi:dihydroceramide fatty acyl 2-hydroxylase